jgi:hypothetical protein
MNDAPIATAQLVLEYLKVLLSPQVVAGVVAFTVLFCFRNQIRAVFDRIKIKFPGGTELSTSQATKIDETEKPLPNPPKDASANLPLPPNLDQQQQKKVEELLQAERARSYLWEYRYLNYFLALHTQHVLDWIASLSSRTTFMLFDTIWLPAIPSAVERRAVITALQAHSLIQIENDLVEITPKGREYIQWRGPLPQPKV